MDFGAAEKFGGVCNLRLDDTNPVKESNEYVEAIKMIFIGWGLIGVNFIMLQIIFSNYGILL